MSISFWNETLDSLLVMKYTSAHVYTTFFEC